MVEIQAVHEKPGFVMLMGHVCGGRQAKPWKTRHAPERVNACAQGSPVTPNSVGILV